MDYEDDDRRTPDVDAASTEQGTGMPGVPLPMMDLDRDLGFPLAPPADLASAFLAALDAVDDRRFVTPVPEHPASAFDAPAFGAAASPPAFASPAPEIPPPSEPIAPEPEASASSGGASFGGASFGSESWGNAAFENAGFDSTGFDSVPGGEPVAEPAAEAFADEHADSGQDDLVDTAFAAPSLDSFLTPPPQVVAPIVAAVEVPEVYDVSGVSDISDLDETSDVHEISASSTSYEISEALAPIAPIETFAAHESPVVDDLSTGGDDDERDETPDEGYEQIELPAIAGLLTVGDRQPEPKLLAAASEVIDAPMDALPDEAQPFLPEYGISDATDIPDVDASVAPPAIADAFELLAAVSTAETTADETDATDVPEDLGGGDVEREASPEVWGSAAGGWSNEDDAWSHAPPASAAEDEQSELSAPESSAPESGETPALETWQEIAQRRAASAARDPWGLDNDDLIAAMMPGIVGDAPVTEIETPSAFDDILSESPELDAFSSSLAPELSAASEPELDPEPEPELIAASASASASASAFAPQPQREPEPELVDEVDNADVGPEFDTMSGFLPVIIDEPQIAAVAATASAIAGALETEAAEADAADVLEDLEDFVVFSLGDMRCVVPIRNVIEVGRIPEAAAVPNAPVWFHGLGNLRGQVLSLIDLRAFFGVGRIKASTGRMVVLRGDAEEITAGVMVDQVHQIVSLSPSRFHDAPASTLPDRSAPFVWGACEYGNYRMVGLDVDGVLGVESMTEETVVETV